MKPTDDFVSEEEYLIREPQAEYKSEYRDGRVVAMSGASLAHSRLTINVAAELTRQLKSRPCSVYSSDTRIKVAAARFYTYPDLSVICGKPAVDPKDPWAVTNPTLIAEVLSPSTEAYDRGDKFEYYKRLASLNEYVLVAQDRILVERFSRRPNGQWLSAEFRSLQDVVELTAIGCRLALSDVYDKVEL